MVARMARARPTIGTLGELGFLARIVRHRPSGPGVVVGPGHDCALVRCGGQRLLYTVDALVEGVHFRQHWLSPYQLGRRSFLVNASDIAAMGGRPRFCVVNLIVPAAYAVNDLLQIQRGIVTAARTCGASVVGGNLSRGRQLSITIALLAEAPSRLVTRSGARPGHRIYVTGTLGDAALGRRMLRSRHTAPPIRRFCEPSPRLQAGRVLVERGIVSAMIDVSDGLLQDLRHLCNHGRVGAVLRANDLPLSAAYRGVLAGDVSLALSGGEDYELLCTVPEDRVKRLERYAGQLGCPITDIGVVTAGRGVRVEDGRGRALRVGARGYDHFRGV